MIRSQAVACLAKIWEDRGVSVAIKKRMVEVLIFPIVMTRDVNHGLELERKKIDVFEMWCWIRILRIPWIARVTNA